MSYTSQGVQISESNLYRLLIKEDVSGKAFFSPGRSVCWQKKAFKREAFSWAVSRGDLSTGSTKVGIIVRCDFPWISFMCFQKVCEVDESVPSIAVLRRVVASARSLFRSRGVTRFLFCLKASRFSTDGFFLSLLRAECFSFIAVSLSLFTKGFFFLVMCSFSHLHKVGLNNFFFWNIKMSILLLVAVALYLSSNFCIKYNACRKSESFKIGVN